MTDFIAGLRADLVEAAAREASSPVPRRLALAWRPAMAAVATAAAVVAFVAVLTRVEPAQRPAAFKVAQELRLGGMPADAVLADGGLWVLDWRGGLRRVTGPPMRLATPASASAVVAGRGRLWAIGQDGRQGYWVIGLDPRSGRRVVQKDLAGAPLGLAMGQTGLWFSHTDMRPSAAIRLDGRRIRLPDLSYIAAGGGTLWALEDINGSLSAVDERSGKVVLRLRGLVDASGVVASGSRLIAADAGGAWVADPGYDEIVRVTRQGVARRLAVGPEPGPIGVHGNDLWVVTGNAHLESFQLKRVDLRTGEVAGGVVLGSHAPRALAPFRGGCWVVAADGTALRVTY